jgi:hypothetical protein
MVAHIPALGRTKQEDLEFQASIGDTVKTQSQKKKKSWLGSMRLGSMSSNPSTTKNKETMPGTQSLPQYPKTEIPPLYF